MEIMADVTKVFGQEMAKLVSEKITEEELMQKAKEAWKSINCLGNGYYNSQSELQKFVIDLFQERLVAAIDKIMENKAEQEQIDSWAKEIIDNVKARTEEKIIESVSDRLAMISYGYGNQTLGGEIRSIFRNEFGMRSTHN